MQHRPVQRYVKTSDHNLQSGVHDLISIDKAKGTLVPEPGQDIIDFKSSEYLGIVWVPKLDSLSLGAWLGAIQAQKR